MNSEFFTKGIFVLVLSLMFAWIVASKYDMESDRESMNDNQPRYLPYLPSMVLPLFITALTIMLLLTYGVKHTAQTMLSMCFSIFLHISLYYIALLLILPLLRKRISARACAVLWLLPNYLYFTEQPAMKVHAPLLIIRAPGRLVWGIFFLWIIGFFFVLLWTILSHLRFRRQILKHARPVTDPDILFVWEQEFTQANMKNPNIQPVISPAVSTPLSIGMFHKSVRVVLPEREYTSEDLTLIFRHELIHISHEDAWAKFFLVFCTAMCWFHPLMWKAMRNSAEDLELSCDEMVLHHADEHTRRRYADLILRTAGDERGFTSCLSASAKALQYRLKNIIKPTKRRSGALIVGLICFVLFMSCGYISLAYDSTTGKEIIYHSRKADQYSLHTIGKSGYSPDTVFQCVNEETLHTYLSELTMETFTGNYSFSDTDIRVSLTFITPEGRLMLALSDSYIELFHFYGEHRRQIYYLPDGVDWSYLDELIVTDHD